MPYAYNADVWCDDCAEKTIAEIDAAHPGEDQDTGDRDDYPQYHTSDGEADCPLHCAGCGTFLENNLTNDGREYVTEQIRKACDQGLWHTVALKTWAPFYDLPLPTSVGEGTTCASHKIHLINPEAGETPAFVFGFGAYGWTVLAVWGRSLDDCLDDAIDWIADNKPGLLCDDEVSEAYNDAFAEAIAEGNDEQSAQEHAWDVSAEDVTTNDGSHYISSHEWCILAEEPDGAEWRAIVGRV